MPEQNDIQQTLLDFHATVTDKPNLSDADLFKKFPEFGSDSKKLQAAKDYAATLESGKYKSTEEVNTKFPEFFQKSIEKKTNKKEPITEGEWEGSAGSIKATPMELMERQAKGAKPSEAQSKPRILNLKEEEQGFDNVITRRLKGKGITPKKGDANWNKEKEGVNQDIKDNNLVHTLNNRGEFDFTRDLNPLETLLTKGLESFTSEAKSSKINLTSDTNELSSYLDKLRQDEPDVQEKASGLLNYTAEQVAGLPKLIGLNLVGGPGAVAADAYWNTRAAKIQQIYYETKDKLIQQGLDDKEASAKAISQAVSDAPLQSVPDALLNYALAYEGGGKGAAVEAPALTASRKILKNYVASPMKLAATAYASSLGESAIKKAQGYNVKAEDAFNEAGQKGTDFALMDLGFHIILHPKEFSKTITSAAKEYISNIPSDVRKSMVNKYGEDAKNINNTIDSYSKSKDKVKDYAPQNIMHNVAGLQEAIDNGTAKIEALSSDKTTPSFVLQTEQQKLDRLKERQNNMLKTGEGDEHEVDNADGNPLKPEDIKQTFTKAEPFIIGDEARKDVSTVVDKINNAEDINENELSKAADHLYDLLDKHGDNKSFANLIEPLIHKIENYELATKTETSTVAKRVPIKTPRETGGPKVTNELGQFEGNKTTITNANGESVSGVLKSENGIYYLHDEAGNKIATIGEKAMTDRGITLPTVDFTSSPIEFNEDGTVKSVTLDLSQVDAEKGGMGKNKNVKIEFSNPDEGLDFAIRIRADQVGEIPQADFDTEYENISKEVPKYTPEQQDEMLRKASNDTRKQAFEQTKKIYDRESNKGPAETIPAKVPGDVFSKPVEDIEFAANAPAEQRTDFEGWRDTNKDELSRRYKSERNADIEETEEQFVRRKYCKGL